MNWICVFVETQLTQLIIWCCSIFSQDCRSVSSQHCSCFDYVILSFFFHIYAGYTLPLSTVRLTHFLCVTFQLSIRSDYDDWRPALASLLQPIPFPKEWVFSTTFLSSLSNCRYHFHFLNVSGKLSKTYTKIWEKPAREPTSWHGTNHC